MDGNKTVDYSIERRAVRFALIFDLAVLFASILIFMFFNRGGLRWLVVFGFVGMAVVSLGVFVFLWFRFRARPEVKVKMEIEGRLQVQAGKARAARGEVEKLERVGRQIEVDEQESLKRRQGERDHLLANIAGRRKRLEVSERQDLEGALLQLQQAHMQRGLAVALIKGAKIKGVGPKLADQLAAHGIVHAGHVSAG